MVGNFSPHEAFAIGGTNSVRGYEEGAVGAGRSYVVGSGEIAFPLVCDKILLFPNACLLQWVICSLLVFCWVSFSYVAN